MKRDLAKQFTQEVEGYRKALLWHARASDWEAFELKAGRLFDYVESIEHVELEKRFFSVFYIILGVLILTIIALFGVNFEVAPELIRLKNAIILAALAASSFELYFFINFLRYTDARTSLYKKRRDNFVRNIEKDFRGFDLRPQAAGRAFEKNPALTI